MYMYILYTNIFIPILIGMDCFPIIFLYVMDGQLCMLGWKIKYVKWKMKAIFGGYYSYITSR